MGFGRYVLKRVVLLLPVLLGVSIISFSLAHVLPGGPVRAALGPKATETQVQHLRELHGFTRPLYVQYINWITDAVNLEFGEAISTGRDIGPTVRTHLIPTVWIAISALVVSVLIGIPAGIISAANQYSVEDYAVTMFAFLGLSIPNFWLGILLILLFGLYLGWLPTIGFVDPLKHPVDGIKHLILPAITLGTAQSAIIARMMRSSMLEVLSEDYILAARAKGLPGKVVTNKHAVQNALLPTITVIGLNFGYLLGGALIVEQIFAIPGIGRLTLQAISNREYGVVQAALLLIATMFALANLTTDLLYAFIDPRIKYE